ncbi:hypothetical protein AAFF_G00087170 [Aldrovandia affinis]|uniref:Uncharacterized protein n=1 Tax=Aldrovandia affinis TaxID=143900 RepID=A0AAD7RWA1_9TELE|nr:hypothetical protein AAFF_G00087170 [Aldrovandia affinis]
MLKPYASAANFCCCRAAGAGRVGSREVGQVPRSQRRLAFGLAFPEEDDLAGKREAERSGMRDLSSPAVRSDGCLRSSLAARDQAPG